MKFLILNDKHPDYKEQDYLTNPSLASKSFRDQLEHRYDSLIGMADFYSKNLNKLGHNAADIFVNHRHLQRRWAFENNKWLFLKTFFSGWENAVLENQIIHFRPDFLVVLSMPNVDSQFLLRTKRTIRGLKIIGQHASPIDDRIGSLEPYDLILSSLPNLVTYFSKKGVKSRYLPLAFESSNLEKIGTSGKKWGAIHVGGYGPWHKRRVKILERAAVKTKIDFWGLGEKSLDPDSEIMKRFHGTVLGKDLFKLLREAEIVINIHGAGSGNYANNMRLFETTGMGTFLLTDSRANLGNLFAVGREVAVFSTAEELADKIDYYSQHPAIREKIAKAGQKRTLKDHTYYQRMKQLVTIIDKEL